MTLRPPVAVDCPECGKGVGEQTNQGSRCLGCGQFAPETDMYCIEHDLDYSTIYPEDKHCPYCREEQRQRDMMIHDATRDPQVEPW